MLLESDVWLSVHVHVPKVFQNDVAQQIIDLFALIVRVVSVMMIRRHALPELHVLVS